MRKPAYSLEEAVAELLPMDGEKAYELRKKMKKEKKAERRKKNEEKAGLDDTYYHP